MLSNDAFINIIHQSIEDGVVIVDQSGKIVWVNISLEKMFGYLPGELINQPLEILLPESLKKKHIAHRSDFIERPQSRSKNGKTEFEGTRKDGTPIWLSIGLDSFKEKEEVFAIASVSNITEQKLAEIGMKKQADRANMFLNLSKTIFLELNINGFIKLINNEGCAILESKQEDIIGKNWFECFIEKKDQVKIQNTFNNLMRQDNPEPQLLNSYILTKSGNTKLVQWHNTVIKDDQGNNIGTLSSGVDITEQELLRKSNTDAVIAATEKERKRVAMELHDNIVQALSAVSMNLKSLEDCTALLSENSEKAYNDALILVSEIIKDTRAISHDLMPHAILKVGLQKALEELALRTTNTSGIKVDLDLHLTDKRLDQMQKVNVFRIIQEFIQNSIKHSGSSAIDIKIYEENGTIQIKLQDNGCGFNSVNDDNESTGIGLQNMRARVESMNGELDIKSSSLKGTKISISFHVV